MQQRRQSQIGFVTASSHLAGSYPYPSVFRQPRSLLPGHPSFTIGSYLLVNSGMSAMVRRVKTGSSVMYMGINPSFICECSWSRGY